MILIDFFCKKKNNNDKMGILKQSNKFYPSTLIAHRKRKNKSNYLSILFNNIFNNNNSRDKEKK